jgi:replicative DNA helicase
MTDPADSLRQRFAAFRAQDALGSAAAKDAGLLPADALPTPAELARQQVADAIARGRLDLSASPRWPWAVVNELMGPMLPGDFVVIGAVTGNGKTSFLLSAMDAWERARTSTLYIPLEMDPPECRARWAAWRLGLDPVLVLRNDWNALGEGAQDAYEATLSGQITNPYIHFAPPKYITLREITKWVHWAHANLGVRQVILDHFQRVDHGGDQASHRLAVHDTARSLRDLARDLGIVIIAAAQMNRAGLDPMDALKPPLLARLKDASGIAEEAVSVLVLSRLQDPAASKEQLGAVRAGTLEEWRVAVPHRMQVTCRKHRLDGEARDRRVLLAVEHGRVVDCPRDEPTYHDWREEA